MIRRAHLAVELTSSGFGQGRLCLPSSLLLFPSFHPFFSIYGPLAALFYMKRICTFRTPCSLTTTSASLYFHQPKVYQHNSRVVGTCSTHLCPAHLLFLPLRLHTEASETVDGGTVETVRRQYIYMNSCACPPFWSARRRHGARYPFAVHSKPTCTINPSTHG